MNYQTYCKPTLAAALHSVGLDKTFHRASQQYLYYYDDQGIEQPVLDLLGGYGALLLGHNHPAMIRALTEQVQQCVPFHNQFSIRQGAGELASLLNPILQQETQWNEKFLCAFTSTGAESVEIALKHAEVKRGRMLDEIGEQLTRQHSAIDLNQSWHIDDEVIALFPELRDLDSEARWDFISAWNVETLQRPPVFIALKKAFHGKLNTTIQLTHGDMYRQPCRRFGLNTRFMATEDMTPHALKSLLKEERAYALQLKKRRHGLTLQLMPIPRVGAILVEPVQGEGGVYSLAPHDAEALHSARDLLGCPLIADEVQSGCGRCGSFLAGSQIGLKPDYVVLSKGLGGGVAKIGLVAIRQSQYAEGFDLVQSSTFGEDDWSARVASAFVRYITANNQAVIRQVGERGDALFEALIQLQQEFPDIISDIRGKGLLQGIVFKEQHDALSIMLRTTAYQGAIGYLVTGHLLMRHGIRIAPPASAGNVVRVEPSIQLSDGNIKRLVDALRCVCLALRFQDTGYLLDYLIDDAKPVEAPRDFRPWYQSLNIVRPVGEADAKAAFVNHLISSEWLKEVDPSLAHLAEKQTDALLNRLSFDRRVAPFEPVRIRSAQGKTVDFTLYPINATSQQIGEMLENNELEVIRQAVDDRLTAARNDGCSVAGLGMFTSIVTNNGKAVNTSGIHLTTGNALTVAMAAEAIQKAIREDKRHIQRAAVIGAAGNIGSVYSTLLAEYCPSLTLVGSGRPGSASRVMATAGQVYECALLDLVNQPQQCKGIAAMLAPFAQDNGWLTTEFRRQKHHGQKVYRWFEQNAPHSQLVKVSESIDDIADADLLVCAANSAEAFIQPHHIKQHALVCDIAVPHNLSDELLAKRADIRCLRGGIVSTPNGESLDPRARAYLKQGQVYACMAETIVLGLEQYQANFSYGNIDKTQVKTILEYATAHGLGLAQSKETESM
ncbi:MAG: pyridoxalphosphate dependent aminotransferase, class III [Kangiellaceae bacterium]|nr:pyridoxalphosphate dependent aminotransferase, class III [Kangiellaceae bacterium]|tara:strand:+ start:5478 stop:8327 length:2850 start_codon:yes stop_codon:yes gene_type:complete